MTFPSVSFPIMAAAALLPYVASTQAQTLDFGTGPSAPAICTGSDASGAGPMSACASGSFVSQGYGDLPGVVDIRYSTPGASPPTGLRWGESGFNSLYGVLYSGQGDDLNSLARIEIQPLAPHTAVFLSRFDLGAFGQATRDTTVSVGVIGSSTPVWSFSGGVGVANSATTFGLGVFAADGVWIEWSNTAVNVGIDNIVFSVVSTPVPEPASASMMFAGAALGLWRLRRRRAGS